ncbi:MAG TPA: TAT-variant-translocated molybdopterin oxidoreductase [Candidatus Binatia bacterium]
MSDGTQTARLLEDYPEQARAKEYWRSLEELAGSAQFKELIETKLPRHSAIWNGGVDRREFLKLMGASLALAGISGCLSPAPAPTDEKIVPYVHQPETLIPGKPLYFATAIPMDGYGRGVLVESHMGRPTKIEGNPQHPASLGATDAVTQASVLSLYDPDRSQVISNAGRVATWDAFFSALNQELESQRVVQGAGLRILTETVTSPTLAAQLQQILRIFPKAKWHQYDGLGGDYAREGARIAFGQLLETIYRFDRAEVVLSLDADFLLRSPGSLRYAREFIDRRRVPGAPVAANRLYVIESTFSLTGSNADHRLAISPTAMLQLTRTLAGRFGVQVSAEQPTKTPAEDKWLSALVKDLQAHRGRSIVIAGEYQPPAVHALAHAINDALGNIGATVFYIDPVAINPTNQAESLRDLARDLDDNTAQVLIMLGGNPAYTAPADLDFAGRLVTSNFNVHLSLHQDETSALCHWHIPQAHYLESWSDVRAYDGTATILQPLIAPLYGGRTAHEILAAITGQSERSSYEIVRDYWRGQSKSKNFETAWRTALHDGFIADSAFAPRNVKLKPGAKFDVAQANAPSSSGAARTGNGQSLEVLYRPDPSILDGRFANNGWLQELPKPLTKLTWDNAALMSPRTAARLGISYEVGGRGGERGTIYADVVELEYDGRRIRGPAWIVPGHADECITIHLGYGRRRAGRVGTDIGFNANGLRTTETLWHGADVGIKKTGAQYALACTQFHHLMEGRDLVRSGTIEQYRKNPKFLLDPDKEPPLSLYPDFKYDGYAWGMSIDVNACIGCNACVVACHAENNGPVVGKQEVLHGREMHWIRVDRYHSGDANNPETYHQPVPCMQCEKAPCELVCPVGATAHSHEGLNDMVYNRCVGTRYCSNNCPYKVRRFNFFQYSDFKTESLKPLRNPDVTVRSRGVMEKCTYCVQRINEAKIAAEKEERSVRDGEIETACQQACPTRAIIFGDINDPQSRVSQLKAVPLSYGLLTELNTRPRTTYQAKLRNPNPEIDNG